MPTTRPCLRRLRNPMRRAALRQRSGRARIVPFVGARSQTGAAPNTQSLHALPAPSASETSDGDRAAAGKPHAPSIRTCGGFASRPMPLAPVRRDRNRRYANRLGDSALLPEHSRYRSGPRPACPTHDADEPMPPPGTPLPEPLRSKHDASGIVKGKLDGHAGKSSHPILQGQQAWASPLNLARFCRSVRRSSKRKMAAPDETCRKACHSGMTATSQNLPTASDQI